MDDDPRDDEDMLTVDVDRVLATDDAELDADEDAASWSALVVTDMAPTFRLSEEDGTGLQSSRLCVFTPG